MASTRGWATPNASAQAASPVSLEELTAGCRTTSASRIPDASPYFIDFGLGQPPVWLVGWGAADEGTPAAGTGESGSPVPLWVVEASNVERVEPYGWPMKALWVIAEGHDAPVDVTGCDCSNDAAVWFQLGDAKPERRVTLDPSHPGIPVQHGGWREFPSYVIFPVTGCYEIEVTWEGGSWRARVPFYAGASEER